MKALTKSRILAAGLAVSAALAITACGKGAQQGGSAQSDSPWVVHVPQKLARAEYMGAMSTHDAHRIDNLFKFFLSSPNGGTAYTRQLVTDPQPIGDAGHGSYELQMLIYREGTFSGSVILLDAQHNPVSAHSFEGHWAGQANQISFYQGPETNEIARAQVSLDPAAPANAGDPVVLIKFTREIELGQGSPSAISLRDKTLALRYKGVQDRVD